MDYPGLELDKLSDDALVARISELHGKMVHVQNFGGNSTVMDQLFALLETLEFEQDTRRNKKAWDSELKAKGVMVETEPDLIVKNEIPQAQKKSNKPGYAPGSLFKKTSAPAKDNLDD
jgi:hypothetical protein